MSCLFVCVALVRDVLCLFILVCGVCVVGCLFVVGLVSLVSRDLVLVLLCYLVC